MINMMQIPKFLREVREELGKVTWLTRQVNVRYTVLVVAFCAAVGVYLGLLDWFFGNIVTKYIIR